MRKAYAHGRSMVGGMGRAALYLKVSPAGFGLRPDHVRWPDLRADPSLFLYVLLLSGVMLEGDLWLDPWTLAIGSAWRVMDCVAPDKAWPQADHGFVAGLGPDL